MTELLQHAVVTAVAVGAAGVLVRRVFGVFAPGAKTPGCPSCAAGPSACGHAATTPSRLEPSATGDVAPLTLHRRPRTH